MKKRFLLPLIAAIFLSTAACRTAETQTVEGTDATAETTETEPVPSSGFERATPLEQPMFAENIWLEEEEKVYYQRSAVIAKGRASNLEEYHVFGENYNYYITAFDFTVGEIFFGDGISVGDAVSVGSFNSSYEWDSSLPIIRENNEYILFLHSTDENEQVGGLVAYNLPSPLFNCIPVIGDYCETRELFSGYGESVRKINLVKGKSLAYEALKNGEEAELKKSFVNENYLALANEESKYIEDETAFENKLAATFVVRLTEFEETLYRKVKEWK